MNNKNRTDLKKAIEFIEAATKIIELIRNTEEEKLDNLPEGLQDSEKSEKFQENISLLDEAIEQLNEAISNVDNACD